MKKCLCSILSAFHWENAGSWLAAHWLTRGYGDRFQKHPSTQELKNGECQRNQTEEENLGYLKRWPGGVGDGRNWQGGRDWFGGLVGGRAGVSQPLLQKRQQ